MSKGVRVKSSAVQRIRAGGLWVYSNELADSFDGLEQGEIVRLLAPDGRPIAIAGIEPRSLIAARVLVRLRAGAGAEAEGPAAGGAGADGAAAEPAIDARFFAERLERADRARRGFARGSCYRAVFSESDALPGLIVDRYGELCVVELLTGTMERLKAPILDALRGLFAPRAIVVRNDVEVRRQIGLPTEDELVRADASVDIHRYPLELLGISLELDFAGAQKTGLFLDQMGSYAFVDALDFSGREGADLFCYSGLFGMIALRRGARRVTFVDASADALESLARNLARNGFARERWEIVKADVMEYLPRNAVRRFEFLFVDPPKFITSRKSYYQGLQGYFSLNRAAAAALADGGLLFTWSCSHHAGEQVFHDKVVAAIAKAGRGARELAHFRQHADHPVDVAMPESFYLKGFLFRVGDPA